MNLSTPFFLDKSPPRPEECGGGARLESQPDLMGALAFQWHPQHSAA